METRLKKPALFDLSVFDIHKARGILSNDKTLQRVCATLTEKSRVLEFFSEHGEFFEAVFSKTSATYVGIEPHPELFNKLKRKVSENSMPRAEICREYTEALQNTDFDLVVILKGSFHLLKKQEQEDLLKKLLRSKAIIFLQIALDNRLGSSWFCYPYQNGSIDDIYTVAPFSFYEYSANRAGRIIRKTSSRQSSSNKCYSSVSLMFL